MSELDNLTAPPPPPESATPPSSEERTWALFGHLSSFTAFVTGGLGGMLGPLVVWLIKRDTMPFAGDQAKEALNFNITVFIIGCVLVLFSIVTFGIGLLLAWPLGIALFVGWVVLTIIAAIKANEGTAYRYPWTLRLVK
ncbi:MAG: DUF4870 domain-containing protein [Dokdonella sp.]|uniref:DUF4870 domain-containing protein n=1 Tax=Dokdonella sp. TaxID=2291710 RepID=UPI0025BCB3A7|nr:DUF4870 domain-containing protein [Dokdonella sp.]MBX3700559.1 DUF4870 domain-containing protein [Dokdonella sp.]MCW5577584.1 DUF4870 domain-containing protein [Dokdonella sp.]